jgi:hypothetical protein
MVKAKNDSDQPWRDFNGLSWIWGSDLMTGDAKGLDLCDDSPLADAVRETFDTMHPVHQGLIVRRFRECYKDLPEEDAVTAVLAGHSHPIDAMRAGIIRKRTYIGFVGKRTP